MYHCNFSSSYQLDISLVQCALYENSNPISTSSQVLFCLLYKHHRHLQTTWKATLLRIENLPFIHQPNKVARKAGDVQQLIGDTNQRILYDKHLFLVIFPLALQFSQIFIFHFHRDNVSKYNNGELFFYCKQLSPILHLQSKGSVRWNSVALWMSSRYNQFLNNKICSFLIWKRCWFTKSRRVCSCVVESRTS